MIKQMGNMEDLIDKVGKSGLIEGKEFQSLGNRCFYVTRNIKKYKDIYYNNSLTSCHYQIEKGLKRKTNEQIQHWLLLLKISHDVM